MESPAEADWLPRPAGGGGRGRKKKKKKKGPGRGRGGRPGGAPGGPRGGRRGRPQAEADRGRLRTARDRVLGGQPENHPPLAGRDPAAAAAAAATSCCCCCCCSRGPGPLAAFRNLQLVPPAGRAPGARALPQEGPPGRGAEEGLQCVCYGLGNFSSCAKARCQLAFLLLLLQELQIPRRQCHVFDPVFSELEIETLNSLSLTVVLENEEGKRRICGPTLFYMVHCGKALYNNLLWRNWSLKALPKMVIVGNSFRGIEERVPARILQQEYAYIAKVVEATREAALPSHPQYLDVFNDTSVHCFPLDRLRDLPQEVWECPEEPFYQDDNQLEIIRNKR
ncbi:hypothetical protein JRQ81_007958 [Phrynocephalus forsythii]|uniref:SRR1-like domain-containing protein n=1 Tax=Phrynocephalus forsythii TaxID=171643 RepID=A0A9Q0XD30_9SAUR|nr:hypothetical protein JRQ81_007958 [Phrynocephalus forsythii]